MDGRRFRRWWLYGGLLGASLGCHRGATLPDTGLPKAGQTVGAITPPLAKKSFWGGSAMPAQTANGMPVEVVAAKPHKRGAGLLPETDAQLADTSVAAALADPPPANRDQLLDMARARYQRALKAEPKNKAALLGLARMHATLGEKDRSVEAYQKYMGFYPKDHEVAHEIAITHGRWRDWPGALSWCEVALQIDPENRTYRKMQGFCLARAGRFEEGFQALCKVMPEPQARLNIAGLLDHLNYPDHSRQWAMMALQADPGYAPAREFLAELDQASQQGPAADPNPIRQAGFTQPQ